MPSWIGRGAMIGAGIGGALGAIRHQRGQSWTRSIGGGAAMGAALGAGAGFAGRAGKIAYSTMPIVGGSLTENMFLAGRSIRSAGVSESRAIGASIQRAGAQIGKLPLGARWARKIDGLSGARAGRLSAVRAKRTAQQASRMANKSWWGRPMF